MPRQEALRVAILGGGPIGMEAALYALRLGLTPSLFERARIGEYLRRWGHVRLFSPFELNSTPVGLAAIREADPDHEFPASTACITGREHVAAYLEPLAQIPELKKVIRTESQVIAVGRWGLLKSDSAGKPERAKHPFIILIREAKGRERIEEADVVLDCTGTYGQHRWLGEGGIPAVGEMAAESQIAYGLEDIAGERRSVYAGKNVMVIGSGYSAATSVCQLTQLAEKHPETWVTWLARSKNTIPMRRIPNDPLKERDRLGVKANSLATRGEGNVEFHADAAITALEFLGGDKGFKISGSIAGQPHTWEVERLIANVGYTPDTSIYRELQVHECYATLGPMNLAAALLKQAGSDCLNLTHGKAESLINPEPNFFIVGAKSFGRNSHFLLRTGFEQIRDVFRLITGKGDLDLYKKVGKGTG